MRSAPVELVRDRLQAAGCRPRGQDHKFGARCPVHDDRHPSLTVGTADDGSALIYCHACGPDATPAIVAKLGLEMRDLFVNRGAWRARHSAPKRDFLIVTVLGQHVAAPTKSCDGVEIPKLPPMHAAVLRCLLDHCFFARTCNPRQELIAEQVGCTREYVNRICGDLRDLGLIRWRHVRAPGARFYHNVYTMLCHWHRPYRRAVVARIRSAQAAIRERHGESSVPPVHSKRTTWNVGIDRQGVGARQTRGKTSEQRGSPPNEADWARIWDELRVGRSPRCAILGAD
jgi:hypothetical protein